MSLIKNRIFLGVVACIIFFSLALSIFQIDLKGQPHSNYNLSRAYLALFNAVIIASWMSFGWIGGALSLAFSVILVLSLTMVTGSYVYYLYLAPFFLAAALSNRHLKEFVVFKTEFLLKKEKLVEERNTLFERMEKDKAHADSSQVKLNRYEALKCVAEHLGDISSLEKITSFLSNKSFDIVGKSTRSLVYLVDSNAQELFLVHAKQPEGHPRIKMKKGDAFDKWVLRQNQPLIVLDAAKDFRFSQRDFKEERLPFRSLIAVPMISHNKMVGLLRLDCDKANSYNPDDLRLLDIIADLGAVSLHNNMLYQRTTELAIRDGLTQLFVHRYFMERLAVERERALKKDHKISVLMADIDHFKEYNDRYGHIAGDILLKHLTEIFTSVVGKSDIVARYGGEEFAVLLFDEDKGMAVEIAERIRTAVERADFRLRREMTKATVSIGVAVFPDNAKTGDDLLRIADKNLYKAKKEGRNRVCAS